MAKSVSVKICGLRTEQDVDVVAATGSAYCGFVFFANSPRSVSIDLARTLALKSPVGLAKVALVVDADDVFLDALTDQVPLDMLQLHGAETPERVDAIKSRYGLPVMKAVGVADASDLAKVESYFKVADQILVDAKPPKNAVLPGGNGLSFDWRLIAGRRWPVPWMLAGGLNPRNVAEAIEMTGAQQVDVSSGVETEPGVKDASLIRAFVTSAHG